MSPIINATDVRKNWSSFCDETSRVRPGFISRTHDTFVMTDTNMMKELLSSFTFSCKEYIEEDGSVTLSLNEMDLADNAPTLEEAKNEMGSDILEYAREYYENFQQYYHAPNRKAHFPYVMKALIINDGPLIGEEIECQAGKK